MPTAASNAEVITFAGWRMRRDRLPAIALTVALALIFLLRCITVSGQPDMGGDIATYLATMNAFFGHEPTGFGLDRPPLIALPLKLLVIAFGDLHGVKLLGILLSVSMAIPFYLLARRVSHPWIAAALATVFILTPVYSDMLTWGYITMTGIIFGLLTIHFFLSVLDRPSKGNIFLTGVCASLVVGFHQLSLAFVVPLFLLIAVALLVLNRSALPGKWLAAMAAVVVAALLSTPYLPLYLRMLDMQAAADSESSLSLAPSSWPWIVGPVLLGPLLVCSLRWAWQRHRNAAIMIGVLLFYSLTLMVVRLPPPFVELNRRAHYFMCPAAWLLAGVVLSRLWSWSPPALLAARRWIPRATITAGMIALLAAMLVISQAKLGSGLDFFAYLDDTRWDAIQSLKSELSPDACVAAYPETLGWWIEAECSRNTATVTDRNTVPYVFLQERSLAAERILSRNQGLESGNLRLATTYPYGDAPGQPVLGVYAGGSFHDILMFDDRATSLAMEDGSLAILADAPRKAFAVTGDGSSMTMTTTYEVGGMHAVQRATLDRGSRAAVVSYEVQSTDIAASRLDIPLLFGYKPDAVTIAPDYASIDVDQFLRPQSDRVSTRIAIETAGAALQSATVGEGQVRVSLGMQGGHSTVTFTFLVTEPDLDSGSDVIHYEVPHIVSQPELEHVTSVDCIAVDLKPNAHLASEVAFGTEEWLNACPYYRLAYSKGDIRVYEVIPDALP